jgi:hypothetical protein
MILQDPRQWRWSMQEILEGQDDVSFSLPGSSILRWHQQVAVQRSWKEAQALGADTYNGSFVRTGYFNEADEKKAAASSYRKTF